MLYKKEVNLPDGRILAYHRLTDIKVLTQDNILIGTVNSWELLPSPQDTKGNAQFEYSLNVETTLIDCFETLNSYIFGLPEWQGAILIDFFDNPI